MAIGLCDRVTTRRNHRPVTRSHKGVTANQITLLSGLEQEGGLFRGKLGEKGKRRLAIRYKFNPYGNDIV